MADATNANDELYPIAVLIDELKVRLPLPCSYPPFFSVSSRASGLTLPIA